MIGGSPDIIERSVVTMSMVVTKTRAHPKYLLFIMFDWDRAEGILFLNVRFFANWCKTR